MASPQPDGDGAGHETKELDEGERSGAAQAERRAYCNLRPRKDDPFTTRRRSSELEKTQEAEEAEKGRQAPR